MLCAYNLTFSEMYKSWDSNMVSLLINWNIVSINTIEYPIQTLQGGWGGMPTALREWINEKPEGL